MKTAIRGVIQKQSQVWIKTLNYNTMPSLYHRQITLVKHWGNLSISNSKPDLLHINACTKFGENPLMFTQVIIRRWKYGCVFRQLILSKFDEICPIASKSRSPHYQSTYQIWWKSIDVYSSNHWETKYRQTYNWWTDGWMNGQTHEPPTWNHNTPPLSCGRV